MRYFKTVIGNFHPESYLQGIYNSLGVNVLMSFDDFVDEKIKDGAIVGVYEVTKGSRGFLEIQEVER
jgi:hypothetical protein